PVFQRVRVDAFVGRTWLEAKIDALLNDPSRQSGAFLLVGDAGLGKTSFLAHLVAKRGYLHLFAEQLPGDAALPRAVLSLAAQIVARYRLQAQVELVTALSARPDYLDSLLRIAAARLPAGERIVIVCDALDEAGTAPGGNVLGLPKILPSGVYLILSQR